MADDKTPPTAADIEGAKPEQAPPNVVTDNSGQAPVQPVGTSDPSLTDNTNPKVPFDGGDPRNIPPHDSNEQLHIASAKREAASTVTDEDDRRKAVDAAYDNSQDVRDVLEPASRKDDAETRAAAQQGNRATPPSGRAPKPARQTT